MPFLNNMYNFAVRSSGLTEGFGAGPLGHSSLSGAYESFVCGCAGCAEKAATAFNGDYAGFRAAGEPGFRIGFEGLFRLDNDGPVFQGGGATDTVPGNTTTAFTLTVGGPAQVGRINAVSDDDYYRVELVAGQSYVFSLVGSGANPLLDPYLELRNSSGQLISINDDSGAGYNALLRFTAVESGTYYINARAYEPASAAYQTGEYTLTAVIGAPQNPLDTIDINWVVPTTTIEVYFATGGQTFLGETALRSWTQTEIDAAMAALATFSAVTPLTFVQTFNQAQAEFTLMLHEMEAGVLGYFSPTQGFGAFSPTTNSWQAVGSLNPGGSAFTTLVHEFGHALGLAHPHDESGVRDSNGDGSSEIMQGVIDAFNSPGTFFLNQGVFTTMTYRDGFADAPWGSNPSLATGSQATPMALDVALLQQLYGVNPNYNNGDTTYTLAGSHGSFVAIWDTGGTDTISYAGGNAATIDLRPATLQNEVGGGGYVSYVYAFHRGFTIAAGVVIENAVGGSGADTIIGNSANNRLTGNGGADSITGNGGIDTAVYEVASSTATWVRTVSGAWTVTAGANGTDTLTTVERLDFTDRDVVLDNAQRSFSGNGTSDLLWRNSGDGTIATWEITGATYNSAAIAGAVGSEWEIQGSGDFSGDGRDDIVFSNGATLAIWRNASWTVADFFGAPIGWEMTGIGDFDFDGRDDFLWRNETNGNVAIWTVNGAATTAQSTIGGAPLDWSIVGVGDFNGNGSDDLLWRHTDGTLAQWTTNGVAQTSASIVAWVPTEWTVDGVGDFDGDGRADILWRNQNDGAAAIWRMDGGVQLGAQIVGGAPLDWSIAAVGDYNGDGKDDLFWRHNDGTIAVWTMNGFAVLSATVMGAIPTEWDLVG